jgi:hypothetical protein
LGLDYKNNKTGFIIRHFRTPFPADYSYLLLFMGTLLFNLTYLYSERIYRGPARAIMIGAILPWIGNLLHITGLTPIFYIDPTPFAFSAGFPCDILDVRLGANSRAVLLLEKIAQSRIGN